MWFLDIIMKHEFKGLEDFFEGIKCETFKMFNMFIWWNTISHVMKLASHNIWFSNVCSHSRVSLSLVYLSKDSAD